MNLQEGPRGRRLNAEISAHPLDVVAADRVIGGRTPRLVGVVELLLEFTAGTDHGERRPFIPTRSSGVRRQRLRIVRLLSEPVETVCSFGPSRLWTSALVRSFSYYRPARNPPSEAYGSVERFAAPPRPVPDSRRGSADSMAPFRDRKPFYLASKGTVWTTRIKGTLIRSSWRPTRRTRHLSRHAP